MSDSSAPKPEKIFNIPVGWHISGISNGSAYNRVSGYSRENLKGVPQEGLTPRHLSIHGDSNKAAERIDPIKWSASNGMSGEMKMHPPFYEKYGDNLRKLAAIIEVCMRYLELNGKSVKFKPKFDRMGYYEYDDPACKKWVVKTNTGHTETFSKKIKMGSELTVGGVSKGIVNYVNCAKKHHAKNSQHYSGRAFDRIVEINGTLDPEAMYAHAAKLVLSGHIPDGGMGYYEEENKSKASDFHYDFGTKRKWYWAGNGKDKKKLIIGSNGVSAGSWDRRLGIEGAAESKDTIVTLEWWLNNVLPERVRKNVERLPDPKKYGDLLPTWQEIYDGNTQEPGEELVYMFEDKLYDISWYEVPFNHGALKRKVLHSAAKQHDKQISLSGQDSQEFLDSINGLDAQGIITVADTYYDYDKGISRMLISVNKEEWDKLPEISAGFLASGLFIEMSIEEVDDKIDRLVQALENIKDKIDTSDQIESWDGDMDKAIADVRKFPSIVKSSILPGLENDMASAGYYNKESSSDKDDGQTQTQVNGPLNPGTSIVIGVGIKEDPSSPEGTAYDIKFVGADPSPWSSFEGQPRVAPPEVIKESAGDLSSIKSDSAMTNSAALNFLAFHDLITSYNTPETDWVQFLEDFYVPETRIVFKEPNKGEVPGLKHDKDVAQENEDIKMAAVELAKETVS